jgi:hypothetical protein
MVHPALLRLGYRQKGEKWVEEKLGVDRKIFSIPKIGSFAPNFRGLCVQRGWRGELFIL